MRLAKNIALFGSPETPYFEKETVDWIYLNTPVVTQQNFFGQTNRYYTCPYCVMDARIQTHQGTLHVKEHTQIDHKKPFSLIVNTNAYDAEINNFIGSGHSPIGATKIDWNDLAQVQVIYNDLDNLWITCTTHNQEKKAKPHFHTKMVMGLGNIVHHKY